MNLTLNAIIGATASGKSSLALQIARQFNLEIFSIDSLSVYQSIDIASAKPSKVELREIKHYGIDLLSPNEICNAMLFFKLLKQVAHNRVLIVGGSSFYLKSMIDGLSNLPEIPPYLRQEVSQMGQTKAYEMLQKIDSNYATHINPNDTYRTGKALELFLLTRIPPSEFFKTHARERLPFAIQIYELQKPKDILQRDIIQRTDNMLECGLIDEVADLSMKYSEIQPFKAIGIKEVRSYLRGEIDIAMARELIIKNTKALAKRQRTFNKTQFNNVIRGNSDEIRGALEMAFKAY